jgi:hypothetical protein
MKGNWATSLCAKCWPGTVKTRVAPDAMRALTASGWSLKATGQSANSVSAIWAAAWWIPTRPFLAAAKGAGIEALRRYLDEHRQQEFLDNFCRKLLAYALGRALLLSDDVTIDDMRAKLAANGYRFSSLMETIVASPQFLNRRDYTDSAQR